MEWYIILVKVVWYINRQIGMNYGPWCIFVGGCVGWGVQLVNIHLISTWLKEGFIISMVGASLNRHLVVVLIILLIQGQVLAWQVSIYQV